MNPKTFRLVISKKDLLQQDKGSLGLVLYSSWFCLSFLNNNLAATRGMESSLYPWAFYHLLIPWENQNLWVQLTQDWKGPRPRPRPRKNISVFQDKCPNQQVPLHRTTQYLTVSTAGQQLSSIIRRQHKPRTTLTGNLDAATLVSRSGMKEKSCGREVGASHGSYLLAKMSWCQEFVLEKPNLLTLQMVFKNVLHWRALSSSPFQHVGVLDQLADVGSRRREAGASHRCPESLFTGPYSFSLTMEEMLS